MKWLLFILLIIISAWLPSYAYATLDPFAVESKVQTDLDNLLGHMMPREQFLVQVNAQVETENHRELIEGETLDEQLVESKHQDPIPVMPGFEPEVERKESPQLPRHERQVFRNVETPVLRMVIAQIGLDESLAPGLVTRAKMLTQNYMGTNFPRRSVVSFSQMPMLKPVKEVEKPLPPPKEEVKKPEPPPPPTVEEVLWRFARWAGLILLMLVVFLLALLLVVGTRREKNYQAPSSSPRAKRRRSASGHEQAIPKILEAARTLGYRTASASKNDEALDEKAEVAFRRKRLLERFLTRSGAFSQYWAKLSAEVQNELYSVLSGPAFDNFLDGLQIARPVGSDIPAVEPDEILAKHEKSFDEFAETADWQDRQFFGFLQSLNNEQLLALANQENPVAVCLMLRFMKARQSAMVLDTLEPGKRQEILAQVPSVQQINFSQIAEIERDVRTSVQRMPQRFYGSPSEDVDFWGTVLSESTHQEELIRDLETTNPNISPTLRKYKFKLEDVASFPDNLLRKILSDVDNEELAMALATCSQDTVDVILDALSPRRKSFLISQLRSAKGASEEATQSARVSLTRRIREAMA